MACTSRFRLGIGVLFISSVLTHAVYAQPASFAAAAAPVPSAAAPVAQLAPNPAPATAAPPAAAASTLSAPAPTAVPAPAAATDIAPAMAPASPAASATAAPAEPVPPAEVTPEITFQAIAQRYAEQNRTNLLADKKLVAAYAQRFLCADWVKSQSNVSEIPAVLTTAEGAIKGLNINNSTSFLLHIPATLGNYDTAGEKFSFAPLTPGNNTFPIRENGASPACIPDALPGWPQQFDLVIENYDAINGIPLPPPKADSILRVLSNKFINEQRKVGLTLNLRITDMGKAAANGVVAVKAEVIGAEMDDGNVQNELGTSAPTQTLYRFEERYFRERKGQSERRIMQERIEQQTGPMPFNGQTVNMWYKVFTENATKAMSDGTELRQLAMLVQYTLPSHEENKQGVYVHGLGKNVKYSIAVSDSKSVMLQIQNLDEFQDLLPLSAEDYKKLSDHAEFTHADVIFTPTGAQDGEKIKQEIAKKAAGPKELDDEDEAGMDSVLFMHIDKIVFTIVKPGEDKLKIAVDAKTAPKPYAAPARLEVKADERPASAFAIAGITAGKTPEEVIAIAWKEISQELTFDEKTLTVRSPSQQCAASSGLMRSESKSLLNEDNKCLIATFAPTGKTMMGFGSTTYTLASLSLTRNMPVEKAKAVLEEAHKQYGEPAVIRKKTSHEGWGKLALPQGDNGFPLRTYEIQTKSLRMKPYMQIEQKLITDDYPAYEKAKAAVPN